MRTKLLNVSALCGLVLVPALAAAPAVASPCDKELEGVGTGPASVSFLEGDLGSPRRVCPRSEAGFGGQATVVFQPFSFGLNPAVHVGSGAPIHASAAGRVFGSLRLTRRAEIFGSFQPVNARLIITSLQGSYIGLGNTSVGGTLVVHETESLAVGVTAQATLPTAVGYYRNAWPVGIDTGINVAFEPTSFLQIHGQLSGVGSLAFTPAAVDPRAGMVGVLGGEFFLWDWVSLIFDVNTLALYNTTLDSLSLAGGFRSKIYAGLGVEGTVIVPILGKERSLFRSRLSLAYRF